MRKQIKTCKSEALIALKAERDGNNGTAIVHWQSALNHALTNEAVLLCSNRLHTCETWG